MLDYSNYWFLFIRIEKQIIYGSISKQQIFYFQSKSVHTPDIWKTQYSKGVIERAIRQSKRYAELDRTLHKSLLPDAKQAAMKWLTSATDAGRFLK